MRKGGKGIAKVDQRRRIWNELFRDVSRSLRHFRGGEATILSHPLPSPKSDKQIINTWFSHEMAANEQRSNVHPKRLGPDLDDI